MIINKKSKMNNNWVALLKKVKSQVIHEVILIDFFDKKYIYF